MLGLIESLLRPMKLKCHSFADEQVAVVPTTTSAGVQGAVHPGTAIVVTAASPQTKEFGKSIPANFSARQALNINYNSVLIVIDNEYLSSQFNSPPL